jgi:DNA-binding NtrC family response regulator
MQDHILVVDDESAVCELVCSQVRRLGFTCSSAAGGEEALRLIRRSPRPSIVLTDVRMPGVGGEELLHELKVLDEHIQVVMISGSPNLPSRVTTIPVFISRGCRPTVGRSPKL